MATTPDFTTQGTLPVAPIQGNYQLENAAEQAGARFAALAALFDSASFRHLLQCGISPGWRCLEVGAGGGSVARWLAERVGPGGWVLATDIDPRFLDGVMPSNVAVRRHDIATNDLPERAFDLVHARLVLLHLPRRAQALTRMVRALKPGGWLVVEEYDSLSMLPAPGQCPTEADLPTHRAMMQFLEDRGIDRLFGRRLYGLLLSQSLVEVDTEGRVLLLRQGTSGAAMLKANYLQLQRRLIDEGYLTEQQFASDLKRLDDPGFTMPSAVMWSARGRRPTDPRQDSHT